MISIKEQEANQPGGAGESVAGGGGSGKVWTITGRLLLREDETEQATRDRPLRGIEVEVSASDIGADGPWTEWGIVRTDADGDYALSEANNGRSRFFRVRARLRGAALEVEDGTQQDIVNLDVLDRNWSTVWKSGEQLDGPTVTVGTRTVASGQPFDLGDETFRRAALIWYVVHTAMGRLASEDSSIAMTAPVHIVYPARGGMGSSWNSERTIFLHRYDEGAWRPGFVLEQFFLHWQQANTGVLDGSVFNESNGFASGFGAFASNALRHEIWGTPLELPLNRRAFARTLGISTIDDVVDSATANESALRILRIERRHGWWSHLFGTPSQYPPGRPDDDGDGFPDHPDEVGIKHRLDGVRIPDGPDHLSLWDILRCQRPNPDQGFESEFHGGTGIWDFIERAATIFELGDTVRVMLNRCIDPLETTEPHEHLRRAEAGD